MHKELIENYISMEKYIETMNKDQIAMKNAIYEMKNKLEGILIPSSFFFSFQKNEKRLQKKEESLREL